MLKNIEINPQFEKALHLMEESDRHVFVTGKAGTGKSTLLEYFRSITKKNIVVLAPTGVAAVNVSGQTIHSFFGFRPDVTIEKVKREARKRAASIYKNLDMVLIDEISMVRADLLDCVDEFLRINGRETGLPFGGIQMIFIGDLYQIPPVVVGQESSIFSDYYDSAFFFDARACSEIEIEHLELEKIYRQVDQEFISLLNKIRNKTITVDELGLLNDRIIKDGMTLPQDIVYLTTTNAMAEERNRAELLKKPGVSYFFEAEIKGEIDRKSFPAEELLEIKEDAQVMFLNNDAAGRWINGTIGNVISIDEDSIEVYLNDGFIVEVESHKWNVFHFSWDEDTQSVTSENVGSFKQYPIKLAWAITIHKSQGKTFDNVMIDLGRGVFASGQLYVALSRCRSLSGIFLKRAIKESDIRVDSKVMKYITGYQYEISDEKLPLDEKVDIIKDAIKNDTELEIIYLKNTDEKTSRVIKPESVGIMEYSGRSFLGMAAYCFKRNERRTFRVDRILEIKHGDTVCQVKSSKTAGKSVSRMTGVAGCLDVETTGLSSYADEIIELALVLFSYDQHGVTGIIDSYNGLREPNCAISNGAFQIHGLSQEDLTGHRLDKERINSMIGQADFLVAHNASFDRGFVTKMFPSSREKRWLCSMSGVNWRGSRGLQNLLAKHGIVQERKHRAMADVKGVLALLAHKNMHGETYFAEMLSGKCKREEGHYKDLSKHNRIETHSSGLIKKTVDGISNVNRLNMPKPKEIKLPLLKAIAQKGGEINTKEAYVEVMELFPELAEVYKKHHTPTEKADWKQKVKATRQSLVSDGCIASNSPPGIWRITDQGKKWLQQSIVIDNTNIKKVGQKYEGSITPEKLPLKVQPSLQIEKSNETQMHVLKAITYDEGTYEGMVFNNRPHGKGTFTYLDGTVISGVWVDGVMEGKVSINFSSGAYYKGGCSKGKLNGYGSITYPDGRKMSGNIVNGSLEGQWLYAYANGQKKKVLFQKGKKVGDIADNKNKPKMIKNDQDELSLLYDFMLLFEPQLILEKLINEFLIDELLK